jgi:hypothetical protein
MRALNDLVIRGASPDVAELLQRLESRLTDGWRRDHKLESRLRSMGGGKGAFCFCSPEHPERPAAALWLQARSPKEWYVANIVPLGKKDLSDDQYNQLLDEFEQRFLKPLSSGTSVQSEILQPRTRLEDYLSPEATQLLRAFSATASRTQLHPSDQQRWRHFLVRAHQDESAMDAEVLKEWLTGEGWPPKVSAQLADEYKSARQLLWSYDEELRC